MINLDNFKILKEDDNDYHIEHPSGHKLVVNKAIMSDAAKGLVKKMAHGGEVNMDQGGSVGGDWISSFENSAAQLGQKVNNAFGSNAVPNDNTGSQTSGQDYNMSDIRKKVLQPKTYAGDETYAHGGQIPHYDDGGQIGQNTVLAPDYDPAISSEPAAQPTSAVPQEPVSPMVQKGQDVAGLLENQQKQAQELQGANVGAAQQAEQAYKDYANKESNLKSPDAIYKAHADADAELAKAYMAKSIDPDRYLNSMNTPSKIATGISLVLGGIGSGLTGQKNQAAEFLQNAINQDIDSQKNDQSKKMNLWRMNREAYGDETRANLATQNQLYTGLQAKIAQAAASAAAPQAKFNGEQMINQIEQQKIANRQRLALYGQGPQGSGVNPLDMASDPNIVPEAARQKVTDEIGKAQYASKNEDQLMKLFDQAEKDNTIAGRAGRLGYEPPSMHSLRLLAMPLLHDETGKPNEHAIKAFDEILPGPGERESTGESNRKALQQLINFHKSAPTARSYGINIENFRSTTTNPITKLSGQEKQYLDFAKAHPSHPLSQDFFAKHPELK